MVEKSIDLTATGGSVEDAVAEAVERAGLTLDGITSFHVDDIAGTVADGRILYQVIHTPGHSRSHVCLWSPDDRLLLSGDHMLPGITPPINFHHGLDDDPLGQFIDGLERIETLDPASVLPGHGTPFQEGARRARSIIRNKQRHLQLTLAAIGPEPVNVKELTALVYERAVRPFQMRMAMAETLGQVA